MDFIDEVDLTPFLITREEAENFFKKEVIDMEEYDENSYRISESQASCT